MAFICIESAFFISRLNSFFQKTGWASVEKRSGEFVVIPVAAAPYFFKAVLVYVSDNYSAAKPAEDIAERVNMDAFG